MELSTPPPVRRLTGREQLVTAVAPERAERPAGPAAVPATNGNGHHPPAPASPVSRGSGFVAAPRRVARSSVAIDRMQVEDVSVSYGPKVAVNSVSLPIRQGEVLALIGPSGCGKTTLLRSLNRLTELTKGTSFSGQITLDGVDIAEMEPTALRRRVTMVFQQPNPFPMSVFDNVAYVLREQASRRPQRKTLRGAVQDALDAGRALRRGRRQSRPSGAEALRRPAAATLHRPRARRGP